MTITNQAPSGEAVENPVTSTPERSQLSMRAQKLSITAGSLVGGLVLWEIVARLQIIDEAFFPRVTTVLGEVVELFSSGAIYHHLAVSGSEYGLGMVLAIAVGISFGIALGSSRVLDRIFSPWLHALYAVPRVALVPIFIVWFGVGMTSKVATVFIMAVFPIVMNTAVGVRTVDQKLVRMADSFLVSRWGQLSWVVLPSSVPYILTGVKVAVANGLIGVVVAEFFGSQAGIGYLLNTASYVFNSVRIFAIVFILAVFGVILTGLAGYLERHFDKWREA